MVTATKVTDRKMILERYVQHMERKTLGKQDIKLMKALGFEEMYEELKKERNAKEVDYKER